MPRGFFDVNWVLAACIIYLIVCPLEARVFDQDFYRLRPGMTAKEAHKVTGKPFPDVCRINGEEIDIKDKADLYRLRFDQTGRLARMEWTQNRPEGRMSAEKFRALARTHPCGEQKKFNILERSVSLISPGKPSVLENTEIAFSANYQSPYDTSLNLYPFLDFSNRYSLSCEKNIDYNQDIRSYFCENRTTLCPIFSFPAGSRF